MQATLHEPGVTGSLVLHMNEQGQLTHVTARRYMGNQDLLTAWSIQLDAYQEADEMRIPTEFEVT